MVLKKILIINNYSRLIEDLINMFEGFEVKIVELEDFNFERYSIGYCGYVLSGGSKYSIFENLEKYQEIIKLLDFSEKPVFGISLGFELIGYAFGEELERARGFGSGIRQIKIIEQDPLLEGVEDSFLAAQAHKWFFSKMYNLKPLASSLKGIEIARHPSKKIYGVQFHPEIDVGDKNSKRIIENFKKLL